MADRFYVRHQGKVAEHGTHAELVHNEGRCAELFGLQAAQFLQPPTLPSSDAPGG